MRILKVIVMKKILEGTSTWTILIPVELEGTIPVEGKIKAATARK